MWFSILAGDGGRPSRPTPGRDKSSPYTALSPTGKGGSDGEKPGGRPQAPGPRFQKPTRANGSDRPPEAALAAICFILKQIYFGAGCLLR
jgi:hypothetical protein